MTTDPRDESDPAVKPQTIDLEAEDVTAEPEVAGQEAPPSPRRPARRSAPSLRWILVVLILGLLAGAWLYRNALSSYFPTDQVQGLQGRIETIEANAKTNRDQLLAVSNTADQARAAVATLETMIKGTATAQDELAARLASVESSLQSIQTDLDSLRAAVASGGTGSGSIDSGALAAIGQRLDALEKDVASLKAGGGSSDDPGIASALRQSLSDIRAKITAGTSYRNELDRIVRIVPAVGGYEILNAYADQGLPDAKGLATELRNSIPTLPQPETDKSPTSDGYWDNFWDALTSVVTIRDIGEADWPELAENAAGLAEAGDLAQAIAQIDAAKGEIPSAMNRWRERAAARLKLEAALEELAKAVELVIAARDGTQ